MRHWVEECLRLLIVVSNVRGIAELPVGREERTHKWTYIPAGGPPLGWTWVPVLYPFKGRGSSSRTLVGRRHCEPGRDCWMCSYDNVAIERWWSCGMSSRWGNSCHRHPTTTYLCSLPLSLFFLLPLALTIHVPSSITLIRPGPLF